MFKGISVLLGLAILMAGCGGGARPPALSGGDKSASADAPRAESGSGSFARSSPAGAPEPSSAPAARDESASSDRASRERPGLGTEYGESRESRVHDVTFERDSSRPFAVATLHYNDRRGVDALAATHARRDTTRAFVSGGGAVTVSVRDSGGDPLEAVHVGDRTFVVGHAGDRYTIVLENHTSHRFEAVATVDGLDVVSGKDGSVDNRGYVLPAFGTLEIDGFRRSMNSVAAFRFGSVADSYAGQMGKARNVGVIGVAFFGERGDAFVSEREIRLRDTANPFPSNPRFAPPPRRF